MSRFLTCLQDDSGQAMTEYALLTSGVMLVSVFFMQLDFWRTPISDFMFEMILNVAIPIP